MTDHRIGTEFFADILDTLHRHGFAPGDLEHQGRAIGLLKDMARIYEGTPDHPAAPGAYQRPVPAPPAPPGQDGYDPVILPAGGRKTVISALGIAAEDRRVRAQMCTDCPDQSCPSCHSRLRDAQDYKQLSDRLDHAPQATLPARPGPARRLGADGGKEAGQ